MKISQCWPMEGRQGHVTIKLRQQIIPTEVTIQHIPKTIAPDYSTAPKEFTIYVCCVCVCVCMCVWCCCCGCCVCTANMYCMV